MDDIHRISELIKEIYDVKTIPFKLKGSLNYHSPIFKNKTLDLDILKCLILRRVIEKNGWEIIKKQNALYLYNIELTERKRRDSKFNELSLMPESIKMNKGIGAGGKTTNINGLKFEDKTDNTESLIKLGFQEKDNYLEKIDKDTKIVFLKQANFRKYVKKNLNIELFRKPDEAYIFIKDNSYSIKIIEKKTQNREGSVETKLWASLGLKQEYEEIFGKDISIEYILCLSEFLKQKFMSGKDKYEILKRILEKNNISWFYGDDDDYFEKLNNHLNFSELKTK